MINNVRIRARKKLDLDNVDIAIDPKLVDTSCITTYRDMSDNYTEGKFLIVTLFDIFHNFCNGTLILIVCYRSY